ncbi:MAG: recombination mediator RecR [Acidimicrobiales bacterium]|jgi:recombination protein RecR|nr:MAG: recombinase RecR [marine actinobacterium MedAcidi-G1]MCH1514255.1 recombination mediator RecR [Acidimicrobiales bacterium]HAQ04612.1 recombination protein RecR [Acidimicrobiaceae bacterium]|tara:strand:+ start:6664 stop:7278 length:615 start_codon:yes stop_codon:yes gene_type:complete
MYIDTVEDVIDALGRLPGIGPKSAQRITFHLMRLPVEDIERLTSSISLMKEKIRFCESCFNISEQELCPICEDSQRNSEMLCVVEEPKDIIALEKTAEFKGRYHVLGGSISPIDGIGPEQLKVAELLRRIEPERIEEVIVAMNPNIEGEATAIYLARLLEPLGVKVTKIASGLPVGGDLEYADELTLGRAFLGRHLVNEEYRNM